MICATCQNFQFFCYSLSKQDFPVHKQRIPPSGHQNSAEFTEISPVYIGISFFEFKFPLRSEIAKFGEISAEISFLATTGISPKNEMVNPAPGIRTGRAPTSHSHAAPRPNRGSAPYANGCVNGRCQHCVAYPDDSSMWGMYCGAGTAPTCSVPSPPATP